jgi:hypothetical protein
MREGYLLIETNPDHPGRIRIQGAESRPVESPIDGSPGPHARLRYVARFGDLDAALMHAHTALRRGLIDIDAHLYSTDPVTAVGAIDAIDLSHRRIYLDPELAADPALEAEIGRRRRMHRRIDRIWNGVGIAAILLLIIKLLLGF